MMKLVLLLFLYCILLSTQSYAQFTKHYPSGTFLKAQQVYHVTKDRNGFLWFSTNKGVSRYDGKNMLHFNTMQGLPDNTVFNVYEDRQGRVWLFTYNGQYCFIKEGQVHHADNDTLLRSLPRGASYINHIMETDEADLYMGFFSGDVVCLQKNGRSRLYKRPSPPEYVSVITAAKKQVKIHFNKGYGVITDGKITYMDSGERTKIFVNNGYYIHIELTGVKVYKDGMLIGRINDERFAIGTVIHAYASDSGLLFCSTSHGLEIINLTTMTSQLMFRDKKITSCTEDQAGNYWITTYDNGVYVLHHELTAIKKININGEIQKVWAQDGTIYFTANKTLYDLSTSGNSVTARLLLSPFHTYYNLLHADSPRCFYFDFWKNGCSERRTDLTNVLGDWPKKIFSLKKGILFAYGSNATKYFVRQQQDWKTLQTESYPVKISAAAQDPVSRDVFFTCGTGLYKCDLGTPASYCILRDSLLLNITDLYAFDSAVIATTNSHEVYYIRLTEDRPVLTVLKTPFMIHELAFIDRKTYLIRTDEESYILGISKHGITYRQLSYPFSFSEYEHIYPYKGYFIVKTENGIYTFSGSLTNKAYTAPKLFFTGLTINGTHYNDTNIVIRNTRRLDIHITPGIVSFGSNDRSIQYRISNQKSGTWYSTASEDVNMILERYGDYYIEMKAGKLAGKTAPAIRVHIRALPPFTQTITFLILLGILIVLASALIFYRVMKSRRFRFERELNYLKLEHKSINALLNPHFIFNAINNIQNLILHSRQEEAAEYLATMSLLIRQNIENLQYTLISMDNELLLLENYIALQNLRFGNKIVLQTEDHTGHIPDIWLPPLLLHTFVENAIVHGYKERNKTFHIKIVIEPALNDYIVISITDNGIGLQHAGGKVFNAHKSSMGIDFNRKRLNRISEYYHVDQSITLKDRNTEGGQGTEVILVLYAKLNYLLRNEMPVH